MRQYGTISDAHPITAASSTEDDLSIIEHMTQTLNSTTSAESLSAAGNGSTPQQQEEVLQASRDVEVGGDEPARRTCANSISGFVRNWKTAIRPWSEFFRASKISVPPCMDAYVTRIKANLVHFLGNYFAITCLLLLCSIITSFWLLVSSLILCILIYLIRARTIEGPIKVGEEKIPSWILYAAAIFITLPLFIFAHVGYIIYCAIGGSIVLVWIHASFYGNETQQQQNLQNPMPEEQEEEDEELTESVEVALDLQMAQGIDKSSIDRPASTDRPIVRVVEPKTRVHFGQEDM